MKLNQIVFAASLFVAALLVQAQGNGLNSGRYSQAALRFLADLQRRLFRQALQRAQAGESFQRQAPDARLDDAGHCRPGNTAKATNTATGGGISAAPPVIVGGEGTGDINVEGGTIKASVLEVDGTLYFTMPDNAWAVDARDGHELWHYFWKTKGGTHIGNRGLGMWNNYLFMETPDDYLVSLDAKTGKERWHKMIADRGRRLFFDACPDRRRQPCAGRNGQRYRCSRLSDSFDPETGELQWKHYTVPMQKGDPGSIPGQVSMRRDTAARKHGFRAHTIRKPSSTSLARAIPLPPSRTERAAPATIFSLAL